jgi:hypothetical protein
MKWILVSAILGVVSLFVTAGTAAAATNVSNTPVSVTCTSTGQACDTAFQQTVTTTSTLRIEFESAFEGCGSFSVSFFVDGSLVHTSAVLGPFQRTGEFDAGPVSTGQHTVAVRATGVPGGCNTGTLTSWAGRLFITTNDDPPPPPTPDPSEEPVPDPGPDPNPEGGSGPASKGDCKNGGWKTFSSPSFKNQGQCVAFVEKQEYERECRERLQRAAEAFRKWQEQLRQAEKRGWPKHHDWSFRR